MSCSILRPVRRSLTYVVPALLVACLVAPDVFADGDEREVIREKVFDKAGTVSVHCVCLLGSTGCPSEFFAKLNGKQRHGWWQDVHVQAGVSVDLAGACHRKRTEDGKGSGLCCEPEAKAGKPDEEQIRNWFGVIEWRWK